MSFAILLNYRDVWNFMADGNADIGENVQALRHWVALCDDKDLEQFVYMIGHADDAMFRLAAIRAGERELLSAEELYRLSDEELGQLKSAAMRAASTALHEIIRRRDSAVA
jgi:hypothetical protein